MPRGRPKKYDTPEEAAEAKKKFNRERFARWKDRVKGDLGNWTKLFEALDRIEAKIENMEKINT